MAEETFGLGFAIATQSVLGTVEAAIDTLDTDVDSSEGGIAGDPASGIGETGFSAAFTRNSRDNSDVTSSFTQRWSDYISEKVEGLQVAFPLKGNGALSTPLTDEAQPFAGIDAIFRCGGLGGASGSDPTYVYTPANAAICSAKMWIGSSTDGIAWVYKDLLANLTFDFTPGSAAIVTADLEGSIANFHTGDADAFMPTFTLGTQTTLAAPTIATVGHNWGIGAAERGFESATLKIDNQLQTFGDGNAEGGERTRQIGRTITFTGTILADTGEDDMERAQLIASAIGSADQLDFQVGTVAGAGQVLNAYEVILPTPEAVNIKPTKLGASLAWEVELIAKGATDGSEFTFTFN